MLFWSQVLLEQEPGHLAGERSMPPGALGVWHVACPHGQQGIVGEHHGRQLAGLALRGCAPRISPGGLMNCWSVCGSTFTLGLIVFKKKKVILVKKWDQWRDHQKPSYPEQVRAFTQQGTGVVGWGLRNGRGRLAAQHDLRTAECASRCARKAPQSAVRSRGTSRLRSRTHRCCGCWFSKVLFLGISLDLRQFTSKLEILLHFPDSQPGRVTSPSEKEGLREASGRKGTHVAIFLTT